MSGYIGICAYVRLQKKHWFPFITSDWYGRTPLLELIINVFADILFMQIVSVNFKMLDCSYTGDGVGSLDAYPSMACWEGVHEVRTVRKIHSIFLFFFIIPHLSFYCVVNKMNVVVCSWSTFDVVVVYTHIQFYPSGFQRRKNQRHQFYSHVFID